MKVEWSDSAKAEVRAITSYIAAANPPAARKWLAQLQALSARLGKFPYSGHAVFEDSPNGVREARHGNYRIYYDVGPGKIVVQRVWHGARQSPWTTSDDE